MERRKFIKNILLAGASVAMNPIISACENNLPEDKNYKKLFSDKNFEFIESLKKEKLVLITEIKKRIEEAVLVEDLKNKANKIIIKMKLLNKGSEEYKKFEQELIPLLKKYRNCTSYSLGSISVKILKEANQYAEQLLENDEVLDKLAFLQFVSKNIGISFNYIHNYSKSYLEKLPEIDVYSRVDKLIELYSKEMLIKIKQEDLYYFFQNENFDSKLNAEYVENILNQKQPEWKKLPANNYDNYLSNNDLSKFNIFEFNRIKDFLYKLDDQKFVNEIFDARNRDINCEQLSEVGGVIPIKGFEIKEIAPSKKVSNIGYYPSIEMEFERLQSLTEFHYHATKFDNSKYIGPSIEDSESIFPSVVFTSLNKDEISIHFYIFKNKPFRDIYDQLIVVSLGLVTKK